MKYIRKHWYFLPPFIGILIILLHDKLTNFIRHNLTFFPCPFHTLTGLYCPLCGGTRSMIALLQGNFLESLRKNPLVICICIILIISYLQFLTKKAFLPKNRTFWIVCAGALFSWNILRNFIPILSP